MVHPFKGDIGRRGLMKAAAGAAVVGAGGMIAPKAAQAQSVGDIDLLNLMLNVEYLLTLFSCGALGISLTAVSPAVGARPVTFSDQTLKLMLAEFAAENQQHLTPMRVVVGAPAVTQPTMDFAAGSNTAFAVAMQRAGVIGAGETFDPYASDVNLLYSLFLLKNISVSAYRAVSSLATNRVVVQNFTGLLGSEVIHASVVRSYLYILGATTPRIRDNADKIAAFQRTLNGGDAYQGISPSNRTYAGGTAQVRVANVSPAGATSTVLGRSPAQVLNQLYLTSSAATSGGFFPQGVNGTIRTSAASA